MAIITSIYNHNNITTFEQSNKHGTQLIEKQGVITAKVIRAWSHQNQYHLSLHNIKSWLDLYLGVESYYLNNTPLVWTFHSHAVSRDEPMCGDNNLEISSKEGASSV